MSQGGESSPRISIATAGQLLDFRGSGKSPISEHTAHEQLRGAVAVHNILQEHGFAYLADEVGMGKTFVAFGVLALFRHFDPSFRVLVIAPRENIQKKWIKELRNFTSRNLRFADLRMKAAHGAPARASVLCGSLAELVRETALDADRDFFARLTSFSLPLSDGASESWKKKRDEIRDHLPWLDPSLFDLRNKEIFKDNLARAINCGLPRFDLVIFDEGHNIKGGFRSDAASRNRVLALAFGHPSEREARREGFSGYGPRAGRVLFLSATPLENDYVQLWNQLDVFGFGARAPILKDPSASDDAKRTFTKRFLIRRVTTLRVGEHELTKNLYRREWRSGGVGAYDEPLQLPGELQRLTVALVQKKVSELLDSPRFGNCFQIGMLASFESFLETARVRSTLGVGEGEATFDGSDQTERLDERQGIDVGAVNELARDYHRKFGAELPHPKMDVVVERLSAAFATGEKALVFVRRVASVKELQHKLEERYDDYLFQRLRSEIKPSLLGSLESMISRYRQERALELRRRSPAAGSREPDDDDELTRTREPQNDEGGVESFFAWFFRGEGPEGRILSGATLQRRFSQAGSEHSTFFEDNHVAWILGVAPGEVTNAMERYLGRERRSFAPELERHAGTLLPRVKKQQRRNVYHAFQRAAVAMLAEHDGPLQERARVVLEERYSSGGLTRGVLDTPSLDRWLEIASFWAALRERRRLREALWPDSTTGDLRERFREAELRRELSSAMMRLGHPFIDLYILSVNRLERLELRAREQEDEEGGDLAGDFLDLLERQSVEVLPGHTSYMELHEAARNFELILAVNDPEMRSVPLADATTRCGRLLRAQQPVGGMFGQVNETLVRQFRMPGYPMVLITTDLLQEGEDLHTFCSSVHHYGISWMPSSMEQRVGRVDRVSSQTDRRLTALREAPNEDQLLQVYYPHLRDTVEVLQVDRVLARLNKFMELMHEELGAREQVERKLDVARELLRPKQDVQQSKHPLRTAFPISETMLEAPIRELAVGPESTAELLERFIALTESVDANRAIRWESRTAPNALFGTLRLSTRQQPFTLMLRSVNGRPVVRCVSPVGVLSNDLTANDVREAAHRSGVRAAAVFNQPRSSYDLAIEGDVLLGDQTTDAARVGWLLRRVAEVADHIEEQVLRTDQEMRVFRDQLELEPNYER